MIFHHKMQHFGGQFTCFCAAKSCELAAKSNAIDWKMGEEKWGKGYILI